jgi:hypothetical protein
MKWRLNLDPVLVSGPSGHFANVGSGSGKSHRIQIDIEITKKKYTGWSNTYHFCDYKFNNCPKILKFGRHNLQLIFYD